MANPIQTTTISPRQYVGPASRYVASGVIYYGSNNIITFNTYKKVPLALSSRDRYSVITKGAEFRPDLASSQFYGSPDFWWSLMEANNMKDILEFRAGVNIRIPDLVLNRS